ncbi:ribonuclease J [Pseudobacteriovorax antillogorgiicola]|uniref:Ribonuclease J n=1 Tax=Pseudobacteriovorax antillogorgiicola TaxID=1513793 RepID=A0A1Y6B6I8_9BACT|nr:ribonuclease J [Pseudobacteriovorax antillogorgiicola]TCS59195.1 ribonuclease J [Pseudobacteriovorax antillogorgiicola]SME90694.1 ribonuclease J [Pseudobacteriovorax antillogorgiicola]
MSHLKTTIESLDPKKLHVLFMGGCGSFGMNITAYIYGDKLYLVDVGLAFASDYEIGIDSHVPDLTSLMECFDQVEAYFITHGHEDHVGALPLILERWPAPVYMTAWTEKIFMDRIQKFGSRIQPEVHVVSPGDRIRGGNLFVDWVHIPHSIPGCCCLLITADKTTVFHTGDFKFDHQPFGEPGPDVGFLKSIAPVTAMIADSTNSGHEGKCPSETSVQETIYQCFKTSQGMIVFSTFSSNFWRLRIVLEACSKLKKKVFLSGASILKTLEIASQVFGYHPPEGLIIDESQIPHQERSSLVVIASGSQGEPRSGLRRIVFGEHKHVSLNAGDTIILSSRVIPGNEKSVAMITSEAHKKGVYVRTNKSDPGIHVSGHAHRGDLSELIELIQPKHYIPVHGTFTQLKANEELHPHSVSVENGSLVRVAERNVKVEDTFDFDKLFVDSWSQRPMSYESMRKRHKIGDSGLAVISGHLFNIDVEFFGLPFDNEAHQTKSAEDIRAIIAEGHHKTENLDDLNEWARLHCRRYLSSLFVKKPVVISKIFS